MIKVAAGTHVAGEGNMSSINSSIANSKPVFIYNTDLSVLLYTSKSGIDLCKEISISISISISLPTVSRYSTSGKVLYGKFILSSRLKQGVDMFLMEADDISELLSEGRRLQKKDTAYTNRGAVKVKLTDLDHPDKPSFIFGSMTEASKFRYSYGGNLG